MRSSVFIATSLDWRPGTDEENGFHQFFVSAEKS